MMDWLKQVPAWLGAGIPAMMVTVARAEGSTPREAGATMLVSAEAIVGTIGGGHLEWLAVSIARSRLGQTAESALGAGAGREVRKLLPAPGGRPPALARPPVAGRPPNAPPSIHRFALGPSLGQCCGGVVWLLIERLDPADAPMWRRRLRSVAAGETLRRRVVSGGDSSDWSCDAEPGIGRDAARFVSDGEHWQFEQDIAETVFPVVIFGAGHVGAALVQALLPLGARITWVDTRDDMFPSGLPSAVRCVSTDLPEAEVDDAPPGTCFLVMTHSHAQDFVICERIFRRRDFAYFGLIGSRSKRASFTHRMVARGLEPSRTADLTCPIGIPGIRGKEPAVIALAVAAELMQLREARAALDRVAHTTRKVRRLIDKESR